MGVGKIFKVLIIIVVCVILGAVVINVLVPNAVEAVVDATEGMIYKATGLSFDFNANGTGGEGAGMDYTGSKGSDGEAIDEFGGGVEGFK